MFQVGFLVCWDFGVLLLVFLSVLINFVVGVFG